MFSLDHPSLVHSYSTSWSSPHPNPSSHQVGSMMGTGEASGEQHPFLLDSLDLDRGVVESFTGCACLAPLIKINTPPAPLRAILKLIASFTPYGILPKSLNDPIDDRLVPLTHLSHAPQPSMRTPSVFFCPCGSPHTCRFPLFHWLTYPLRFPRHRSGVRSRR